MDLDTAPTRTMEGEAVYVHWLKHQETEENPVPIIKHSCSLLHQAALLLFKLTFVLLSVYWKWLWKKYAVSTVNTSTDECLMLCSASSSVTYSSAAISSPSQSATTVSPSPSTISASALSLLWNSIPSAAHFVDAASCCAHAASIVACYK